jgi:integrase/recombinase XerD
MAASEQQMVGQFLETLAAERGASDNTLQAYRRDLGDFVSFLAGRGRVLAAATPADVSAYLRALAEGGLAPASRMRRLSAVRQLYKFLVSEGVVAESPAHGIAGPRKPRALP